jgi:hypothetical protein
MRRQKTKDAWKIQRKRTSAPVASDKPATGAPRFEDIHRILGDQRTCVSIPVSASLSAAASVFWIE